MLVINDSSGFKKMDANKQQVIRKAAKKLESFLKTMDNFTAQIENNPVIHDAYGNFYVYKYISKNCNVRILYTYEKELDILTFYKFHFKKGDRDNSKYIDTFKNFVRNFKENEVTE